MSPFWILAVALAVVAVRSEMAAAAENTPPRIAEVRIGLAGHYKVGHWTPVRVEVEGLETLDASRVEVTVADSDGVPTTSSGRLQWATSSEERAAGLVYTRVGRAGAVLQISLLDGDRRVHELTVRSGTRSEQAPEAVELPATGELLVALGAASFGMTEAFAERSAVPGLTTRRIAQIERLAELPRDWFGYEAVDVLVLSADDDALLFELAADATRYAALLRWVELGGRVVVLGGGEKAEELLRDGGPLAALVPGTLDEIGRLPETGSLEHFARSDVSIAGRGIRVPIMVSRLENVEGQIEVYAGRMPTDLPLVVRAARGLGEVTFAAVDLTQPPLADWPGRSGLLQALLRPYLADLELSDAPQTLVTRGYNDLSGALRQRLGGAFVAVAPITFPVVAVLAIAYLLVLGPLDYLLVHRWLRRPWVAWVSFPLMVLLFGVAAMALADWRNGAAGTRVNRLELVDIDMTTGQARGTFWASLYSPRADQFDLALEVEPLGERTEQDADVLLSWWGLPGVGIGGMQAHQADLGIVRRGYAHAPQLDALQNVPVLTASTKSLLARWTAPVGPVVEAELADDDGLVAGSIANRTGRPLHNIRLFYGGWAYRLGSVEPGQRIDVGRQLSPRILRTIVTQDALGSAAPAQAERQVFVAEQAAAAEVLHLMMFYEAAGGVGFAKLPSQVQAYCDLSRLLGLGRAILVADVPTPGSRLVDRATGQSLGGDEDAAAVVYRFVLPVTQSTNEQ